jgi:sugar/nucleoside kinase (ribokinase family)
VFFAAGFEEGRAVVGGPLIVVAGHTCLDIIPTLTGNASRLAELLEPGGMWLAGPMVLSTGGAVPNTGLALQRLGTPVRLAGKVGDDLLGQAMLALIRREGAELAGAMIVTPGAGSAYSVVISGPGIDRTFIHYPGPNDTFRAADVPDEVLAGASLLHFGYPSLMRQMYLDRGEQVVALLHRARRHGLVTSLDVSLPDVHSEAGRVNWRDVLRNVLPHADLFLPGVAEVLWMMDPQRYTRLIAESVEGNVLSGMDGALLGELADSLLAFEAAVVGLKLGEQGMYLRTTSSHDRLAALAGVIPGNRRVWLNRELLAPAFQARLVGTTGAGDCAVAGFLTALVNGLGPEAALTGAVAVGACNVEAADAVSGVPAWDVVQRRIAIGWARIPTKLRLRGWGWEADRGLWFGPWDRGGAIAQSSSFSGSCPS